MVFRTKNHVKKVNLEEVFRCVGLNAMQLSCFLLLFLIPLYSSNLHISPLGSPLLIISHHSQFTCRNNNWSSIQQHIQWRQRGIWYKMFQMHLISSIFIFLGSKLVHCIHNNVLHISWKLYWEIFHIGCFIDEKPFLWILPMSDDSNN